MGIVERKEREKTLRRALILECAKELIIEQGIESVSMEEIAERAELSKSTLYAYFSSKEEILEAISAEAAGTFLEGLLSRLSPEQSALESLRSLWANWLEIYGDSDEIRLLLNTWAYNIPGYPFQDFEKGQDEARPEARPFHKIYGLVKDMIARGVAEGCFAQDLDTALFTRVLITMFSCIMENAVHVSRENFSEVTVLGDMEKIFEILLRGIASPDFDGNRIIFDGEINPHKDRHHRNKGN